MDGNPKQLIVERIKNATNILVTVGRDPSVDALAAALGFTLMLNKMDKHATAVFSGAIPPAIDFLEPGKTFESTVDSLRDFIIALDKEKADRLRYKVEDDVVRIFITPYKTTISEADLQFSQGDFNVELVVALGVDRKEDLDAAVTAHGRILHDAAVVTINADSDKNSVGEIDWSDANASSLCEMLMSLSEALQSGLLDEQIATGLLTGIVAATDRFSNPHTSPKVMTMAAQLMAAGANQQLIAAKLEEGHELTPQQPSVQPDGTQNLQEGSSAKLATASTKEEKAPPESSVDAVDGEMQIEHTVAEPQAQQPTPPLVAEQTPDVVSEPQSPASHTDETALDDALKASAAPATPTLSVSDLQKDLETATQEVEAAAAQPSGGESGKAASEPTISSARTSDWRNKTIDPPSLGGTLNATSSEAEEAKRSEEFATRNRTILSHGGSDAGSQAVNTTEADTPESPSTDPFTSLLSYEETLPSSKSKTINPIGVSASDVVQEQPAQEASITPPQPQALADQPESQAPSPTIAELEEQVKNAAGTSSGPATIDEARAAVDAALDANLASPLPPPEPAPSVPPMPSAQPQPQHEPLSPPPPPMPDFSSLPPLPPLPGEPQAAPLSPPPVPGQTSTPPPNDPGQFRIPGQ